MDQSLAEFVRIPPRGQICPVTSLSRKKIIELVRAKKIDSVRIPSPQGIRNRTLVHLPSLLRFLRSSMEGSPPTVAGAAAILQKENAR